MRAKPFPFCGCSSSCRYPLNLQSSSRVPPCGSGRSNKSSKKHFITFLTVDISRFTKEDKVKCLPISIGSNCSKAKLLCRKCGIHVGYGCEYSLRFCGLQRC